MKFFTFTILLVAMSRSEGAQDKRGVVDAQQYAQPAAVTYARVQQPQKVAAQPQYYTQQAAAPAAYSLPVQQQFQYQPQAQAVAYAQPTLAKYAAAPAPEPVAAALTKVAPAPQYRQPFSPANDVSSFTYSSPFVTYNSLGLLTQVVGKGVSPSVQAKAAPAPVAYQAQQPSQVAYAPVAQAKYAFPAPQPVQRYVAAAPQQYLAQDSQQAFAGAGQAYQAASQAAQAYTAQSAPAYASQAAQTYTAQSAPQSFYAQAPQFYSAPQQVKQGVAYAQ